MAARETAAQDYEYDLPSKCQSPYWLARTRDAAGATASVSMRPYVSPSIVITDIGNVTIVSGVILVGTTQAKFINDRNYVVADSNSVYGGYKNWGEVDGRTYITNLQFVAVNGRGNVSVGRMTPAKFTSFKNDHCRLAGGWFDKINQEILFAPTRMTLLSNQTNSLGAHEMGHYLGFSHVPKYFEGMGPLFPPRRPSYMGYGLRSRSAEDMRNFVNAYRR